MTIENLEKELNSKKLNSVYLLYGEELFLLESNLKKIKSQPLSVHQDVGNQPSYAV